MADHGREGLHRGFIVYTGSRCHQIDETAWALPLAALRSQDELRRIVAADDPAQGVPPMARTLIQRTGGTAMINDGATGMQTAERDAAETIFLIYVHADDEVLDGVITGFAHQGQAGD